jgi:hypothetical protein
MAMIFKQYAVTAAAVDLGTALAITDPAILECREITISYAVAAANAAFLGGSTVTAVPANAGFVFPVVAANIPSMVFRMGAGAVKGLDLRSMYLIGTANAANVFYISIVY